MEIVMKLVSELVPYQKNTKKHNKEQIKNVAESIKEYGFIQPIVIDTDNVVVIGHCRLMAAKRLHKKKVPCVCVDDLTPEQVKALRIVDNKTNESEWDKDFLPLELDGLDMSMFDFDFDFDIGEEEKAATRPLEPQEEEEPEPEEKVNERSRTNESYNLGDYDEEQAAGFYQMPMLSPCSFIPKRLIGFNYAMSTEDRNTGIHFYVDDYQFERVWNQPHIYMEKLKQFQCILTPDFSLYSDMPRAMKVWNIYRSRMIGQIAQREGIQVIPTVSWAEPETFDFCFDGLPKHSTLSISTIGVKQDPGCMKMWAAGVTEMIKRLKPKTILLYGGMVDYDFKKIKIVTFENEVTGRMKNGSK